jgi:hypothetical protein
MPGGTAQAGEHKNDRYHQQAVDLAFAEFGINWHSDLPQWNLFGSRL